MGEKRRGSSLPEPSRIIDRAAEAAADAGDLGAELLSTGVDATTSVIGRLTSSPEELVSAPRRHAKQPIGPGTAKRTGATVKRAAEVAAQENRKMARAEASAGKRVVKDARKASSKVAKAAKPKKSTKSRKAAKPKKAAKKK